MTYYPGLSSFNSKSQIDVAILDFSKAFDTVPHAGLLGNLEHYGIDSKILLRITNFLNNRKQRVVVDGSFSNYADVESGVPQGTVLGPCRLTWLSSYMYISTIGNYCMTGSRYHYEYYKTV